MPLKSTGMVLHPFPGLTLRLLPTWDLGARLCAASTAASATPTTQILPHAAKAHQTGMGIRHPSCGTTESHQWYLHPPYSAGRELLLLSGWKTMCDPCFCLHPPERGLLQCGSPSKSPPRDWLPRPLLKYRHVHAGVHKLQRHACAARKAG